MSDYIIDVELGTGERRLIRDDDAVHPDTFVSMFNRSDVKAFLLDMYHPVGSYFETTDATFNPNNVWGGTWVTEVPGLVHVSGGTGYTVNTDNAKTAGDSFKSFTPSGTVANTRLTANQSGNQAQTVNTGAGGSHAHTASGSTGSAGNHHHGLGYYWSAGRGSQEAYMQHDSRARLTQERVTGDAGSHTHTVSVIVNNGGSHSHSVTIGAKDAVDGHNHGFTGTPANIDVMQPYKTVYRWYRTA